MNRLAGIALLSVCAMAPLQSSAEQAPVVVFDQGGKPGNMKENGTSAEVIQHGNQNALRVAFSHVDWPNVSFKAPDGTWDWSAYAGLEVDVFNPGDADADVSVRVDDDAAANGYDHCNTASACIFAGKQGTVRLRFNIGGGDDRLWGMRGLPERGPIGQGVVIDTSHIVAFQVFLPRPPEARTLIIESIRLFGQGASAENDVPMPFVDRFGQYKHRDWPGKLHGEEDFARFLEEENKALADKPSLPSRDAFGGWADGPQLEATGWFRTQKIDGKWWFVTPDGHLFLSLGMDCVGTWQQTFVEGRDEWFEELPDPEDPKYKGFYGKVSGAHSNAAPIGGKGATFSFYRLNLMRKYGDDWPDDWREMAYRRLPAWGFNTIANWSQEDVLKDSPMPFVASFGVRGKVRELEGARGYWGHMRDVFDPAFAEAADRSVANIAARYGKNPLCLGYFSDNELSWETIRRGTLASPPDQPCRQAFIEQLKAKHGDLAALNKAWKTEAADWDTLEVPSSPTAACNADLDEWVHAFALRYFTVICDALRTHTPNQLYLGCRFSSAPPMAVRACAEVADVVSYNLYYRTIPANRWVGDDDLGKPIIIGEFHFGALDRGMFHTGLVQARDQADRAARYIEYVRSVADHSAFVGCHWFQYVDEPNTGRWFDGENYNIGFVTVVDSPYPELTEAAKQVHAEVYERRFGKRP